MTQTNRKTDADRIANDHGCDIVAAAFGRRAIQVQRRWSQGQPQDSDRVAACRKALEAAGVDTSGWQS